MVKLKQFTKQNLRQELKVVFGKISTPLMLFGLASLALAVMTPIVIGVSGQRPTLFLTAAVGVGIIILSALFIKVASRILQLRAAWAILITFFLSTIAIINFVLIPDAMYSKAVYRIEEGAFLGKIGTFDPNNIFTYIFISIIMLAIYLFVFGLYYLFYRAKVMKVQSPPGERKHRSAMVTGVAIVVVVLLLISFGGGSLLLLILPLSLLGFGAEYFNTIFWNGGLAILIAFVVAMIFAYDSIQKSARDSIELKRPTLIVACAWIAFSVLLMYQIVWIVYMTVLLTIAPFKVIYFSSK